MTIGSTGSDDPNGSGHRAWAWFADFLGVVGGLTGIVFAVVTLPTTTTKAIAAAACAAVAALLWQAIRRHARGKLTIGMIVWLAAAGLTVASLFVVFTDRLTEPTATETPTATSPTPSAPTPTPSAANSMSPSAGTPTPSPSAPATAPGPSAQPGEESLVSMREVDDFEGWSLEPVVVGTERPLALSASPCWLNDNFTATFVTSRRYARLRADIGIADDSTVSQPLRFSVLLDGKQAATTTIGLGRTRAINVDVSNATQVSLRISTTSTNQCHGDTIGVWINPRLTVKAGD